MIDVHATPATRTPTSCARRATRWAASSGSGAPKEEWDLLLAMHRGYLPAGRQPAVIPAGLPAHARATDPSPDAPSARQPAPDGQGDRASLVGLSADTPEWSAWSATMRRACSLAGRWALAGYAAGQGPVFGQVIDHRRDPHSGDIHHGNDVHVTRAAGRR